MATVCEVCYVSSVGDYLDIFQEDHKGSDISHLLSKHLQCVTLDGIEQPQICVDCWKILQNFHGFYNMVEDLHRPQPESCSSTDDDEAEGGTPEISEQHLDPSIGACNETDHRFDLPKNADHIYEDEDTTETTMEEADLEELAEEIPIGETGAHSQDDEDTEGDDGGDVDEEEEVEVSTNVPTEMEEDYDKSYKDSAIVSFYGAMVCHICESKQMATNLLRTTVYDTFAELRRHMQGVHNMSRAYLQCPLCAKRLYLRCKLWQHIDMHNNPEKYRCPVCAEVHQDLSAHSKNKHMGKHFECAQCAKRYPTRNRLATHVKVAHAAKDVICSLCNKSFSKYLIKGHLRSMHGEAEFVCEWCGKAYRTITLLNKHKAQHQSPSSTQCPVCKQNVRENYVERHMKLMHTESPPVVCGACGKSFLNARTLHVHLSRSCPANTHHCATCSKSFKSVGNLNEHQATHKERAFYMCAICVRKFESKSLLYAHQQETH